MHKDIRQISRRQFDAYCYVRAPFIRYNWKEFAWFEAFGKKLLGVLTKDLTDGDFNYVILGRDKRKVFRAVDLGFNFFDKQDEAKQALLTAFAKYEYDGKSIYEQGDEKKLTNEILVPKVSEDKLHPYFRLLTNEKRFESAKNLINEIVYTYVDVDGNYIRSFQTEGFNARLWELYLYVYLHNAGFKIDNRFKAPDYCISYFDQRVSIEAVTVNSSMDFDEKPPTSLIEINRLSRDYMPIKFGSALFSKLQKKYWEQEHVKGYPFVLAIHDYHMAATLDTTGSMVWSRSALPDYLYGYRMKVTENEDGTLTNHVEHTGHTVKPVLEKIESHNWKTKSIPSGFFFQPEAENISAVLFSNNATITTFNRMGKLGGLGNADAKMLRTVTVYDPDPMAVRPLIKTFDIDAPDYEEGWADGLIMYHNPRAIHKVDPDLFPDISHMFFDEEDKQLWGRMQPYDVLSSVTQVILASPAKGKKKS